MPEPFASPAGRRALARLRSRPRMLAFDLDGTLAPIAGTPGKARLPEGRRRALAALARSAGTRVALVSGRALKDLRRKARLPGCVYFGSHGLRCSHAAFDSPAALRRGWRRAVLEALRRLRALPRRYPGCLLEDKGPDLSVHYRQVAPLRRAALRRQVRQACAGLPLRLVRGKQVLELRPLGAPGKEAAVLRLAAGGGRLLYVGDDRTDEDAFAALAGMPRVLTVKVGPGRSRAAFRMGAGEMDRLLERLS